MDIINYSFGYKLLSHPNRRPQQWECIITENTTKDSFGIICDAMRQPTDSEVFAAFCDKKIFKDSFFLNIPMELIKDIVVETPLPPAIPQPTLDTEIKNDSLISVELNEEAKTVENIKSETVLCPPQNPEIS